MSITYGPIAIKQYTRNVFEASTRLNKNNRVVTITGHTPEIAKQKLILFLENKPYKHLDQNGSK